jgi:hypothetical protein
MALFLELKSMIDVHLLHLCDAEFRLLGILQCGDDGTRNPGNILDGFYIFTL